MAKLIIHGRNYLDLIPDCEIDIKNTNSEIVSSFKRSYGGVMNVVEQIAKFKFSLLLYCSREAKQIIEPQYHKIICSIDECSDVKALILKVVDRDSRLSIIEKNVDKDLFSPISTYTSSNQVLFYLESIPRKVIKRKKSIISIFNGGSQLIDNNIFEFNLSQTDLLITSNDSYHILQNYEIERNLSIPIEQTRLIHSPKNIKIIHKNNEHLFSNPHYEPILNNWNVGAGDYFSLELINSLSANLEKRNINMFMQACEEACYSTKQFLEGFSK